mmetsp:Transcript_35091/g.34118  ORF Transcript_35091/g.34118 Transcript_35091/m.34118 type:complete len:177 (-) Transcript_35091:37-567(-)
MLKKTIEVNTLGVMYGIREFLPDMMKNNKGHIITVSSVSGFVGLAETIEYSASKAAATQIDECLKILIYGSGRNIKTTCICPFFINTGMFDGAKGILVASMLDQEYVVNRIVTAIRQEESYVVMPWICHLFYYVKNIMPNWLYLLFLYVVGGVGTIDPATFKGRGDAVEKLQVSHD